MSKGNKTNKALIGAVAIAGAIATADASFNTSYQAEVIRVIDGDTVEVSVELIPGLAQVVDVRERNLDTPEKRRGRFGAQCEAEREKGLAVSKLVGDLLPPGTIIGVENVGLGKYAGRWVGDIKFQLEGEAEALDLGDWLIGQGLAVAYDGGTKQKVWCPIEAGSEAD
ncbi:MAG: hypothetical protein AAGG72_00010 [Pseudomonadota bacterium]